MYGALLTLECIIWMYFSLSRGWHIWISRIYNINELLEVLGLNKLSLATVPMSGWAGAFLIAFWTFLLGGMVTVGKNGGWDHTIRPSDLMWNSVSSVIIDQLSSLILLHVTNGSHRYRQYDMTTTMTTTMTMCYYNVLRYFTCRYQGCGRVKWYLERISKQQGEYNIKHTSDHAQGCSKQCVSEGWVGQGCCKWLVCAGGL